MTNASDDLVERWAGESVIAFTMRRIRAEIEAPLRTQLAAAEAKNTRLQYDNETGERLEKNKLKGRLAIATKALEEIACLDGLGLNDGAISKAVSFDRNVKRAREALHALKPDGEAK